jgi:hypothetical protein
VAGLVGGVECSDREDSCTSVPSWNPISLCVAFVCVFVRVSVWPLVHTCVFCWRWV